MDTRLHSSLQKVASAFILSIKTTIPNQIALQFYIRDKAVSAFVIIDATPSDQRCQVHDGKHLKPDMTIFLSEVDLLDIINLGCVRNSISIAGSQSLTLSFRTRFMLVSPEGRRLIEAKSAAQIIGPAIDHVSVKSLSAADFISRYAVASIPVVISDAMTNWRASPWSVERMRSDLRNLQVVVRTGNYTSNIYKETMEIEKLNLGEYIESCFDWKSAPDETRIPPYAASNVVPLEWLAWLDHPPFIHSGLCSSAKFWVGPSGASTPLHRDWADNFLTQLIGTKQLALFSPSDATVLSPRAIHPFLDSCNWVDSFDPNDPIVRECNPVFLTLHPGEMLFLPAGWFHEVRATSFSFSVNFFITRIPYAVCP